MTPLTHPGPASSRLTQAQPAGALSDAAGATATGRGCGAFSPRVEEKAPHAAAPDTGRAFDPRGGSKARGAETEPDGPAPGVGRFRPQPPSAPPRRLAAAAAITAALATPLAAVARPPLARASAEGPGTPQAVAAHAEFLATLPAPPGGAGAVCVIDSGVDTDTDLGPALVKRSAFDGGTPDDTGARGDDGTELPKHGTYVAGVIASQIDGIGTNGIWPAARILSRRVFSGPTSGTTAQRYINAIQWCIQDPVDDVKVINLSLAGLSATLEERGRLEDKIAQARAGQHGVNVVAAAGNNGQAYVGYPAAGDNVLAVGGTDGLGKLTTTSNRGSGLDISTFAAATCLTSSRGSRLAIGTGTSYATPIVSAILDALRSYRPDLTPEQAEQLLLDNADIAPEGKLLNAARAFVAAGIVMAEDAARPSAANACAVAASPAGSGPTNADAKASAQPPDVAVGAPPATSAASRRPDGIAPMIDLEPSGPSRTRRASAPLIRSVVERQGMVIVRISWPGPRAIAIFRVSRRTKAAYRWSTRTETYVRASPRLQVRARGWTAIRIQVRRSGLTPSEVVTVHRRKDLY